MDRARHLRQTSTDAEALLWRQLRNRNLGGHKFNRQEPIGPFIVDFACRRRKLVIELDGGQHADQARLDWRRTAALERLGYRVVRFWNNDVLSNVAGVLQTIANEVAKPRHPNPLPVGERERTTTRRITSPQRGEVASDSERVRGTRG